MKKLPILVFSFAMALAFIPPVQAQQAPAVPPPPKPALGNISTGWTYLYTDEGKGERSNLNGWYLRPSFSAFPWLSLYFDSTNYYGQNHKGRINSHGFTFGGTHAWAKHWKVKPGTSLEVGDVRSSNAGKITNSFVFGAAFGLTIPINKHVDIALTPAEYIGLDTAQGWRNDYNTKVGIAFPFGHR